MKKRTSVLLCLTILFSLFLLNLSVFAKIQLNSVIEKDGSILLPSQKSTTHAASGFTQAPLRSPEWKTFFNANGKWTVLIDKATLTPHRAFGKPVQIKNFDNISNDNVQSASMQFLRDNSNLLNINPDNLKLTKTKKVNKLWYVGYKQVYQDIEVLLSEVELRIREDGKVIAFGVDYYNDINVNITPIVPLATAMTNAYSGLKFDSKKDVIQSEGKVFILPVKNNGKVRFSLVYDIKVETTSPFGKYKSFVDAHSGNVLWRINKFREVNTNISTKGSVKQKYSYDTSVVQPFPNQYFSINAQRYLTDENGEWTEDLTSSSTITAVMEGKWAKVDWTDTTRIPASFVAPVTLGNDFEIEWKDNNSHKHERMLFYHTNYIHDYVKNLDTSFYGMDFQVNVSIMPQGNGPNAMSDGRDLLFIGTDLPQYKFAETPSILYHEYTHSLNAQLYNQFGGSGDLGMVNAACNEATADLGSSFMIDDEMIGRGAFASDNNRNIRTLENNNIYPDSIIGESHNDGLILSGAYWDFRKTTSRAIAEQVSHYSKYGTPDDPDDGIAFNEWFLEALLADDNLGTGDNDPSNGTPHIMELVTAFNEHQIGTDLLFALSFEHTPLSDTKDTVNPYIVEFDLKSAPNILGSHPVSISVVYTTNNFVDIIIVPALKVLPNEDPDSTKYRSEILAQNNGTLVRYYITAIESVSGRKFIFAGKYPEYVPYEFLVGYETLYIEDFEDDSSWTVGGLDDDASNGEWEWAVPQEENLGSGQNDYILQPGEDHSIPGLRCYVTGPMVSAGGLQAIMRNMPNGTTTLTSITYDLSKTNNPLARYFKYFTSEFLFANIPGAESKLIFGISNDDGSTWINADTLIESTWGWSKSQTFLRDYIQPTNKMKFRFTVLSYELQPGLLVCLTEALVDDFEILYAKHGATSVEDINSDIISVSSYPNPFSTSTSIYYDLLTPSHVTLNIYDLMGNRISSLVDNLQQEGRKVAVWNGTRYDGSRVNAGMYIYRIQAGSKTFTGKLILY